MPCNRRDCPDPGAHVHLSRQDEAAVANVLLARWWRRRARDRQALEQPGEVPDAGASTG